MRIKLRVAVAAALTLMLAGVSSAGYAFDSDDPTGCWGCGNRPLPDGYHCDNGSNYEHMGGFDMFGWYGWKASHREAYCGRCTENHDTCLWGAREAEQAVQMAMDTRIGLREVVDRYSEYLEVDDSNSLLIVRGCEGEAGEVYQLSELQLAELAA